VGFVIAALGWRRVAAAERLANRRADTLTEVNRFQERILRGAYGTEKGSDVRLADVVDAAARDLDSASFDDPVVEAGARNAIGASYIGVGRLDDAERELLRGRALLEQHGLDPHAGLAISISGNLGVCYEAMGRTELAEREARRSLDDRVAAYPADSGEVAIGQINLAMQLLQRAAWDEGLDLATRAHRIFVQRYGTASLHAINARAAMAKALRGLGRTEEAWQALDEARVLADRHLHADHPTRLGVLSSVAAFQLENGQLEASLRTNEEVVAIHERVSGPQHPKTLNALRNLAAGQGRSGHHAAAEATLRRVVAAYEASGVRDGFNWVATGQSLNAVVRWQGRAAEAERMARALLETARHSLPAGHWLIGLVTKELGGCLCDLRRFDEAEPLLLEAYDLLEATLKPDDHHVQRTVQELVALYEAWQRPEDAARWNERRSKPR
jgi:non-specific serine/threonine protein kinase/serine/threonine-protein kinase